MDNERRIRVIHILKTSTFSGAENVVLTIINSMKNDFQFYYVSFDGSIREKLEHDGINFYPVKKMSTKYIKKMVKELKPDIIHAHDFTASVICALSKVNVPIISHIHNNPLWLKKICINSVNYLITSFRYRKILMVSDSIINEYIFSNFIKKKSKVIGNPININSVLKKSKMESNYSTYDIIFLGRLSEAKNPMKFIEIIEKLITYNNKIKVAMIGSGELAEICKKEIINKELTKNIELLGFIDNPYPILAHSKLLLMPSKWEGFGLAAVEALSLGVPVVAANVGGLVNIVEEKCGRLCNCDEEFICEVNMLLENEIYWREKSKNALKRAKELVNIDEYTMYLKRVYREIYDKDKKYLLN